MVNIEEFDGSAPSNESVSALLSLMYTKEGINDMIVEKLRQMNPPVIETILHQLCASVDADERYLAVEALVRLSGTKARPAVLALLTDEFEGNRCAACLMIVDLRDSTLLPFLVDRLLNDSAGPVRYLAAAILGKIGDVSVITPLSQAAETDNGSDFEGRNIKTRAKQSLDEIARRLGKEKRCTIESQARRP